MSFILDALKKSEERRRQEDTTGSGKHIFIQGRSGQRRWPLWLLMALLPTALFLGWWLGRTPQPPAPVEIARTNSAVHRPSSSPAPPPVTGNAALTKTEPAASGQPTQSTGQELQIAGNTRNEPLPVELPPTATIAPIPEPVRAPVPVPVQKPSRTSPPGKQLTSSPQITAAPEIEMHTSLPTYAELSRETRQRLPRLEITLHFFSNDPVRRMVRINGRLLHEGETIADGLTIHEITSTATVLDYQGLLFELNSTGG